VIDLEKVKKHRRAEQKPKTELNIYCDYFFVILIVENISLTKRVER